MIAVKWTPKKMLKEFMRFNIVGTFNTSIRFIFYVFFYWANVWAAHRAVTAWILSSIFGLVQAHYMHHRFTFKSGVEYATSLKWTAFCLAIYLVISTILNYILVERVLINHYIAWGINICLLSFVSFALIRWLGFPPEKDLAYLQTLGDE